jgi:ER-bound oxygenase mpaB/B'/Rubber oxygenase, catalytic domain
MPPWSEEFMNAMRQKADLLADDTVVQLFGGGDIAKVNRSLEAISCNTAPLPADLPPPLRAYLEATAHLPEGCDLARVERAQNLFTRHGSAFGVALMYASLPALYAGSQGGVQILAMTGQLAHYYRRRAAETLRFILDVMTPGGLQPGGHGIRTAQKVRLMHATIRHFARISGRWAALPQWGAPINQEELAGTLAAFSVMACDNVGRLGVKITPAEAEDYLYAWHCIGHVLGIPPELRPLKLNDARSLWQRVAERNFAPSPDGKALARDHLKFLDEMVPTRALDQMNAALMRFLLGRDIATRCLGIGATSFGDMLVDLVRAAFGWLSWLAPNRGPISALIEEIHLHMMEALQSYWAGGKSRPFRLPTHLETPP